MPFPHSLPPLAALILAALSIACTARTPTPMPDHCPCGWAEALDPNDQTPHADAPSLPCVGCVNEVVDSSHLTRILEMTAGPVVVSFTSEDCDPCGVLQPMLEQFALARAGDVTLLQIDVIRSPALAALHGVDAVPALHLFIGGKEVRRVMGLRECQRLEQFVRWP